MKPKRYKAKDKNGAWVVGWYVELHLPRYDDKIPERVIGYNVIPSLFNDEEGVRSKGCYWHTIDPNTMQEVNDDTQLTLF